jgi:hypothetical protein
LLNKLQVGDIVYSKNGFAGITGHICIVEGKFTTPSNVPYIRLIEAIGYGVCRSVLDDKQFKEACDFIVRPKCSQPIKQKAVQFAINELHKHYSLSFSRPQNDSGNIND